ncbi:polyunsaturated fatty acid lipoxygenase ALOX15B-like isoform X1 [Ambystoma mexicanum]|uniref:polyunsaturated fatty acid lipoxygenase ALOX15B-like isoform X1 n=2 Tax=Ambystoma mexicanum TaxID=8296 RepID=UPI0037E912C9
MALYKVAVATGNFLEARTRDYISITLVGALGAGQQRVLDNFGIDFLPGAVDEYRIKEDRDLGEILLIRLHKGPFSIFPEDNWYCMYVTVTSPGGVIYRFPCYRWIEGYPTVELAEGTAMLSSASNLHVTLKKQRVSDLEQRRKVYRWKVYHPSFPKCIDVANNDELDKGAKYSITKTVHFVINKNVSNIAIKLKGFDGRQESWKSFDELKRVYWTLKTAKSEYVSHHWKEDAFFGYQYLNGPDPTLIKRCNKIPGNFPVTDEMVSYSLGASTSLEKELQKGNIYIVDHKMMEGLRANVLNGKQQYMAAPLCLFYRTPKDEVIPLAIQLNQTPGSETPLFLPSDNEWDWILAKIWVRSTSFAFHQAVSHFLRTHVFAEVFCLATLRQLPMAHPLYKLLVPHLRYTLQINVLARERLIGPGGAFDKNTAVGIAGIAELIKRDMETLKYSTLCLPENLQSREVESLPHFYYRDDGMKIWLAIESYVSGIVDYYYKSEESIQKDPELQAWVAEIFKEGFLERKSSGIPSSLETRVELIKYLTMVIFTCSAEHAAVNSGQFDFLSWMPNGPSTMRQPPPKTKGLATMESVLEALPEVGITTNIMTTVWTLSKEPGDMRPLGTYPDEHFTEEGPKRCIRAFQERLSEISREIEHRNASLPIKYNYMNPKVIENSVSI